SHTLVRQCEGHLGFRLPRPLRDYYLRFGEHKVLCHARGLLLAPEALETDDEHLVIWDNLQGGWCGVRLDAVGQPDPPVERQGFVSEEEVDWVPECRRLGWFLLRTMCWQAAWGLPVRAIADATPAVCGALASRLALVGPGEPLEGESVAYAGEGLAVCVLPG